MRTATSRLQPRWSFLVLVLVLFSFSGFHGGFSLTLDGVLLLSFKNSVLSDPLSVLSSWSYEDFTPCSWNGVVCAAVANDSSFVGGASSSRVISLVLPNAQLLGSIPGDLGGVEHLRHLDLSGNQLNGTLPSSLFNASELRVISLSNNVISGEIPEVVGNLDSLQVLNLSDNALIGRIPQSLGSLPNLTVVSIRNNYFFGNISGAFEQAEVVDFSSNLVNGTLPENGFGEGLKYLNLSNNRLTGGIPASFGAGLPENATVDLSYNNLTGAIPAEAAGLVAQKPTAFTGNPGLCGKPLKNICSIPSTLSDPPPNDTTAMAPGTSPPAFAAIPKSVDSGGGRTSAVNGNSGQRKSRSQVETQGGLRPAAIAGIVVADLAGIALVFMVFLYFYHLKKKKKKNQNQRQQQRDGLVLKPSRSNNNGSVEELQLGVVPVQNKGISKLAICIGKKAGSDDDISETTGSEIEPDSDHHSTKHQQQPEQKGGLLVTVDGEKELELETLLKASAYILGATGSSIVYKAVLADGTAFAVRRIGDGGGVEKLKDFEAQVRNIAKLRHPNIVRIRGFYWGTDEKLLIYDFATNGSLANISYKKTGSSPFHLPWDVRLRIAKGVARGLAYLHDKKAVHGNLKPSNILLSADMDPMLGDFGVDRLAPGGDATSRFSSSLRHFGSKRSTLSQSSLQEPSPSPGGGTSSTRYHAPECLKNLKPNSKWDVYSFGMVLLELLTGRVFDEAELVEWNGIAFVPEERNWVLRLADGAVRGEVVGKEDALLSCFRLGFSCAFTAPQKRPSMKEALQVLEKIPSSSSSSIP